MTEDKGLPAAIEPDEESEDSSAEKIAPQNPDSMVIVGIGASAGGLEALRTLIPTLPIQKNLTYVIVQHMDPKHDSMLAPILERDTTMKVMEIKDGQTLISGVLNIVPPGMDACMVDGKVRLEPATRIGPKPSIDRFFLSLAKHQGEKTVGIILSGTGSDGAHGVRAIKAEGGITIAQEEATAKFASMPHAAIATGHVDLILPPQKVGARLPDLVSYPRVVPVQADEDAPHDNFTKIFRMVLDQTGGDFRDYKPSTLRRRIERRMAVNKVHSLDEYVGLLKKKPEELHALHKDLLISVTDFFRDKAAYEALEEQISKVLGSDTEDIRIWVAGCATGEEAFSIAILLSEHLGKRVNRYNIQIFASDLDNDALAVARQAIYPKASIVDLDKHIQDTYFVRKNDTFQVTQPIRDMVLFAHHNLVKDPPFSHLNMITCRNVLIYFNINLQRRVLQSFHYALEPKGVMFLGKSETTGATERLFLELNRKNRIYQRNTDVKAHLPHLSIGGQSDSGFRESSSGFDSRRKQSPTDVLQTMLVGLYQPNCVLLDEQLDVTYIRGNVGPYVGFREGRAVLNVLDLVKNEFRHDLRGLLYKAQREDSAVRSRRFKVEVAEDEMAWVTIATRYFGDSSDTKNKYLVVFEQSPTEALSGDLNIEEAPETGRRVLELESELRESRESLQTTIEELETANEELQSTYEEAQSTNEELFTSSEELQTSNEELQSTNEELRTVNEELGVKSNEVESANEELLTINARLGKEIDDRVTAEKQLAEQERKLRTIIESEPAWVNICDPDGTIVHVNPAGLEIMEAESADDLVGKRLEDFVEPGFVAKARECYQNINEEETTRIEVAVLTLKGNPRWLESSAVALPVTDGGSKQIMSIVCDHTVRKQAQEQAMHRQVELAQVMRLNMLGEMASGLAHELNQPLSAINNYIGGCERRMQDNSCNREELLTVLRAASEQARRAGDIVNQVKHFVRNEDVQHLPVAVNDIIVDAVKLVQATGEYSSVKFTLNLAKNLPKVKASAVQIEQVLINLIHNGIESMSEAEVPIEIVMGSAKSGSRHILLSVEDKGLGLPQEQGKDIFKPFFTTKNDGMGMGLSISRSIIETHAGKLEGSNQKNGGAVFSFKLPVQEERNS